ncbi:hypothetical protein NXH76_05565 [Blautia schinkii]|nr:hypothetical protein [Blautia schinkii]
MRMRRKLATTTGLSLMCGVPCYAEEGMEIVQRTKDGKKYMFVPNFQAQLQDIFVKKGLRSLYDDVQFMEQIKLDAYETGVFEVL